LARKATRRGHLTAGCGTHAGITTARKAERRGRTGRLALRRARSRRVRTRTHQGHLQGRRRNHAGRSTGQPGHQPQVRPGLAGVLRRRGCHQPHRRRASPHQTPQAGDRMNPVRPTRNAWAWWPGRSSKPVCDRNTAVAVRFPRIPRKRHQATGIRLQAGWGRDRAAATRLRPAPNGTQAARRSLVIDPLPVT
jgi:hypothetical protein